MAKHKDGIVHLSTLDLIKAKIKKNKAYKPENKIEVPTSGHPDIPAGVTVNHLAVVLDGEVQEIIRAQNRLTALLLSEPKFIEFNPEEVRPEIGWTYDGETFSEGI
jgi:hypothetical protein